MWSSGSSASTSGTGSRETGLGRTGTGHHQPPRLRLHSAKQHRPSASTNSARRPPPDRLPKKEPRGPWLRGGGARNDHVGSSLVHEVGLSVSVQGYEIAEKGTLSGPNPLGPALFSGVGPGLVGDRPVKSSGRYSRRAGAAGSGPRNSHAAPTARPVIGLDTDTVPVVCYKQGRRRNNGYGVASHTQVVLSTS